MVVASVRGQDGSGIRMGVWAGGRMSPAPIATMGANYFFPHQVIGTAATVFNPGSLRDGGSYGVITIENGECSFTWKRVPEF